MKLRLGVFLLLIAASYYMQQILGRDLLDTILTLFALYVIYFWLFNFFKKRSHETSLKPDIYVKMNRIAAAYSRKSSKAQTSALLHAAIGSIDKGDLEGAKELADRVHGYMDYQPDSVKHLYLILQGYICLFEKDLRGAKKAVAKSPLDNQILESQKREIAFVRALTCLAEKDKQKAEEQIARLNEPKNNRQQLLRLFVLGWFFNLNGKYDRAVEAMKPIAEHGNNLWIYEPAERLKIASENRKEFVLWKSV